MLPGYGASPLAPAVSAQWAIPSSHQYLALHPVCGRLSGPRIGSRTATGQALTRGSSLLDDCTAKNTPHPHPEEAQCS